MRLDDAQIQEFHRDGYCVAKNAVTAEQLQALNDEIALWVQESRRHVTPFGEPTIDGRPRFDMGEEHSAKRPALRRVNNPSDISQAYYRVMSNANMVNMVAQLIGPNVKFHHCKINLKLPASHTEVALHQDFAYTPHTNSDVCTALLLLDEMTPENGALSVVPGSHRGPMHSLFRGDRFTGVIADETAHELRPHEVPIYGKAGSVCLMHTKLVHGSEANRSNAARGLYICVYAAADAFPLARNPMANPNEGLLLRGKRSRQARLTETSVELPEQPKSASFFTVIGQASKNS